MSKPRAPRRRDTSDAEAIDARLERLRDYAPFGVLVLALVGGYIQGPPMAALILAAGALVLAISLMWSSLRSLFGETRLTGADAFALGAPSAEEEQKRAVLRAIKDLEFERAVGKISEKDYRLLVAKYRAEAKRLLRKLDADAEPARERAAAEAEAYMAGRPVEEADEEDEEEAEDAVEADDAADTVVCPSCGKENDEDAVFCKSCGARLAGDDEDDDLDEDDEDDDLDDDEEDDDEDLDDDDDEEDDDEEDDA